MLLPSQQLESIYATLRNEPAPKVLAIIKEGNASVPEKLAAITLLRGLEIDKHDKLEALIGSLADKSATVMRQAVFELGELGDENAIVQLKKLTEEATLLSEMRYDIYVALGKLGDASYVQDCIERLYHENEDERFYAALALSESASSEGLRALELMFKNEQNSHILTSIATQLARHGKRVGEDFLASQLNCEGDDVKKLMIASSLANLGNERGLKMMESLILGWKPSEMFAVLHIVQRFMNIRMNPDKDARSQILEAVRAKVHR